MIYSFKHLQDAVLGWLDERTDDGTTRFNVRGALNQAQQQRLSQYPWPHMIWDRAETLTMLAGQQVYAIHQEYSRPLYFRNRNSREMLVETPGKNIEPSGLDQINDEGGNRFVIWGRWPVKFQPSAASIITIVSDSDDDNGTDYTIIIKGVNAADAVVAEAIVPSGTTPVDGTTVFTKILAVTKAQAWNGTLTMTSNDAAVTNLTLSDCEYGRQYPLVWMLSQPTAGDIIEYKFYRQPLLLVNDFDIPEIPAPFCQVLVWDALLLLMAYDGQLDGPRISQFRAEQLKWEEAMTEALWEGQSLGAEPRLIRDRATLESPGLRY